MNRGIDTVITATPRALVERQPEDRRRRLQHYEDQTRMVQLEGALSDCLHYIATTWGPEDNLPEPQASIAAKKLLGWTLG